MYLLREDSVLLNEIIDPITGLQANALTQPEIILESHRKKESNVRALMDIRLANNPGQDLQQLYSNSKVDVDTGLAREYIDQEILAYSAKKETEALNAVQQVDILDPTSLDRSQNILENIGAIKEHFTDLDGYWNVMADYNAPEDLASIRAQENAVQGRAYEMLEDLTEGIDGLDVAVNWAAYLVPDFIKDASDLIGEGVFSSPAALNKAAKDFQTRTPAEQAVLIEEIVPALWKAYDQNHAKVDGMLGLLFNKSGSGTEISLGVGFDLLIAADIIAILKAGKAIASSRSLATRAVNADAIEEAARRQVVAGVKDPEIEKAIGVTNADAAHSANPMPTSMIDEGASIDDIAGEIDIVKNRQIKIFTEELLPISGNKLDRGTFKSLMREKVQFQKAIAQLNLEKKNIVKTSKGGNRAAQERLRNMQEINADIAIMGEKLAITQSRISANRAPVQAEADLSRLKQGIIPERFTPQFNKAVEKALIDMRKAGAKSKEPTTPPVTASASAATNMNAAESVGNVANVRANISNLVQELITPKAFTPEEQAKAIEKAQEAVSKELNDAGTAINGMNIVDRTDNGFTIQYSTTSGESERTLLFTKDDVGSVISENEGRLFKQKWQNLFGKVFSPEVLLQDVFPKLVADSTFAGQQASKLRSGLAKLWKEAEVGLSKQERFQVDSILLAGDEEAKVFSIAELREGLIETQNGVIKMTPRQIESYYEKRAFFEELHNLRSISTKRQLEIERFENLNYVNTKGVAEKLIGRRKKNFDLSDAGVDDLIYFPGEETSYHSVSVIKLKSQFYKDEGYEVVELLQPIRTKKGKEVKIALVKRDSGWTNLPDTVLNYQPGYVPRIYQKGYYYVRDLTSPNQEVLYAFPTKDAATDWSRSVPDTAVFSDREFNAAGQLVEDSNAYGGLYTGARKSRPLLVKDGSNASAVGPVNNTFRPERMSVGNATERYIQNITSIMPLNDYRATAIERWKNTVNNLAKAQNRRGLTTQSFDGALDLEKDSLDVMEQTRQYIQDNMKMPSREERVTERIALGASNMLYGKPFADKPRQWLLDHSQGSVSDWIKGHSFNLHMGWFNARQLFMQMQNSSLAISMNPTHAIPAIGDTLALRSIAMLPEGKAIQAAKHMGLSDDIIDSFLSYNKSGLRDSIVRQADMDMNTLGIAHGSLDVARKLSQAGRVFFNEGENFSRMLSWNIARRKWKIANPGKKMADSDIMEASQEALRLQMNLQSENAAWWQKAPGLSVATQFLQVQAKFLENVMPKVLGGSTTWTPKEKMAALAGQLFLYGTVGVPIAEEAVAYAADLAGMSTQEFVKENPGFTDSINEGFVGMLTSMMGADGLAPTESFNLLSGIDDNVVWSLGEGAIEVFNGGYSEEGAVEMFTGPSANIIRRVGDVAGGLMLSMKSIYEAPTGEVAYQAIVSNLDDIAALTSTWTNARKLYTLNTTDRLMSSRGTLVATKEELGDVSLQTQLGIAMGYATDKELQVYKNQAVLKSASAFKTDAIKDLKGAMIDYANTGNEALYAAKKSVLLLPFSPVERMKMLKTVNSDALLPKSKLDQGVKKAQRLIIESNGRIEPTVSQSQLLNEDK